MPTFDLIDLKPRVADPAVRMLLSYSVGYPTPEKMERVIQAYLANSTRPLLGLERDGKLVGYVGYEVIEPNHLLIHNIAVEPPARRQGIGRQLIERIISREGAQRVTAETDAQAVDFYRRCGFSASRFEHPMYAGVERFRCELVVDPGRCPARSPRNADQTPSDSSAVLARWTDQLQALARTGLFYASNDFDRERYRQILAIASEMPSSLTGLAATTVREEWAKDGGHVTPKVGVGAAIFDDDGKLLLLQRPESGRWSLPVGFCEVGETAASGIAREVREETGLLGRARRLLGVYDRPAAAGLHHLYNLVFWCVVEGGTLTRTAEAPDLGYFSRDTLPSLVPHHQKAIADAFAMWHDGWRGPAFDA